MHTLTPVVSQVQKAALFSRFARRGLVLAGLTFAMVLMLDAVRCGGAASSPRDLPQEARVLTGILEHKPYNPYVKSAQAYTGAEFFLITESGRKTLRPTEAVSSQRLKDLDGSEVEVTVVWDPGEKPNPQSQRPIVYPVDEDGGPAAQGAGWRVWKVIVYN